MSAVDIMIELESWIGKLEALERMQAAPLIQAALAEYARETIAAGTDALGNPWKPKADGSKPLANAAGAISTYTSGNRAGIQLTGIEVRHHRGWVKGGIKRPIIPTTPLLPYALNRKIVKKLSDKFQEIMR